jgi:arginine/lysine/ornithine decarboxylase
MADFSTSYFKVDHTKTIFRVKGLSGYDLRDRLESDYKIQVEKGTRSSCLVSCYVGVTDGDVEKLLGAVE